MADLEAAWREIVEKDDRTSPPEYPDMALITFDEFRAAILADRKETIEACENYKCDAERYRWLRSRDVDTISAGGIFIGVTPENLVVNFDDADARIDAAMHALSPSTTAEG